MAIMSDLHSEDGISIIPRSTIKCSYSSMVELNTFNIETADRNHVGTQKKQLNSRLYPIIDDLVS